MNPALANAILVIILALVVGLPVLYIYKSKKAGAACIGCPYAKECKSKSKCNSQNNQNGGGCNCH